MSSTGSTVRQMSNSFEKLSSDALALIGVSFLVAGVLIAATVLVLLPDGGTLDFSDVSGFSTLGILVWAGSVLSISWIYMTAGKTTYRLKFMSDDVDLSEAYNRLVDLHGALFISVYFVVASVLLFALGMVDTMGVPVNLLGAVGVVLAAILAVTLMVGWMHRNYRKDMLIGDG